MSRHLVVIGLMGAGKSSVGRPLAEAIQRPFVDNDAELEARTGLTAGAYQEAHGRDALHREELEVLRACLARPTPSVITAAASVVDTDDGQRLLREAAVAWVDADPSVLAERVADDDGHRPGGLDEPTLARQRADRWERFAEVADVRVRTDASKAAAARQLLEWVRMHGEALG
jgi:shikimate kinase